MSHIRMYPKEHINTKGGPGEVEDNQDSLVSHVSHSVHVPPKEHIYTKGGPG
jgi:hypothetical protein